jgi:hypothetical protein
MAPKITVDDLRLLVFNVVFYLTLIIFELGSQLDGWGTGEDFKDWKVS